MHFKNHIAPGQCPGDYLLRKEKDIPMLYGNIVNYIYSAASIYSEIIRIIVQISPPVQGNDNNIPLLHLSTIIFM